MVSKVPDNHNQGLNGGGGGSAISAPPSLLPVFAAAADASLALIYTCAGRYEDVDRLRRSLANADLSQLDAVSSMVSTMLNPPTTAPTKRNQLVSGIDPLLIQAQRWRGLLLLGRVGEASAAAKAAFQAAPKSMRKPIDDETAASQGRFSKLSPLATLRLCIDNIPPEMHGAANVYGGTFNLVPTGKAVPANIHASVDLWISPDLIIALCTADEPRNAMPPTRTKQPGGNVLQDESFELSFNPDRWFDVDYQLAVNSAGVTWAARFDTLGGKAQARAMPELRATTSASKTPTGWTVRIVMPRTPLIRPAGSLLRFDARRIRYVQERGQQIRQIYSWSPSHNGDRQPDRYGWLIVPGSAGNGSDEEYSD